MFRFNEIGLNENLKQKDQDFGKIILMKLWIIK